MNSRCVLCLFGLLFLFGYVDAKRRRPKPLKQGTKHCLPMSNKTTKIYLKCRSRREVIYNVTITSYTSGTFRQPGHCSGLQPEVLTASIKCYWSRSCKIAHSSLSPIVRTDNIECIGHSPSLLNVQYSCMKSKTVIYMKDRTPISKNLDFGVIVSHSEFPWNYKRGTDATLRLKPKARKRKKLFLTAQVVDIDSPMDQARVENGTKGAWINIAKTGNLLIRASETRFQFLVNNDSAAAKGFVLCFYWAEERENLSSQDICKIVQKLKRKREKKKKKQTA